MTDHLLKIEVALSPAARGSGFTTELLWALPRGGELFEVRSIPFFEYNLNLHDVVRCDTAQTPARYVAVHEASGHETLRIAFGPDAESSLIAHCITDVRARGAVVEPVAQGRLFAVSFASWPALVEAVAQLDSLAPASTLSYETGYRGGEP